MPVIRKGSQINERYKDDEYGLISDSLDPKNFADLIEELFVDKNLYEKISLYNYHYAQEHFMASNAALRLEKIYKEAICGDKNCQSK